MSIRDLRVIHVYGSPGERGVPAHTVHYVRTQTKNIPPATMVLIEREWMRLRHQFTDTKKVPMLERIEGNSIVVHPERYALAAVFNRNELRPRTIEPLRAAYAMTLLGQLILPLTTDGNIILARKRNQRRQFSGFGAAYDYTEEKRERVSLLEVATDSVEQEVGSLNQFMNARVLGVVCFDQEFRRGADSILTIESKHDSTAWKQCFETSEQFDNDLLIVPFEADSLIAAVETYEKNGERFSPSAIASIYLALRSAGDVSGAERFAIVVRQHEYPLQY